MTSHCSADIWPPSRPGARRHLGRVARALVDTGGGCLLPDRRRSNGESGPRLQTRRPPGGPPGRRTGSGRHGTPTGDAALP